LFSKGVRIRIYKAVKASHRWTILGLGWR